MGANPCGEHNEAGSRELNNANDSKGRGRNWKLIESGVD
jgi:hypothetical protein